METNKKRRKNDHFRHNKKVKQKWVESGCCGLFFTCNGNERQAVREAYNIIEQTLEIWKNGFPEENLDDKNVGKGFNSCGDEEDVADSVKRFCDQDGAERAVLSSAATGVPGGKDLPSGYDRVGYGSESTDLEAFS
uniref:THUMP domain-containing protein n=1 Tax=Brugia malayi TaxID=6279 RepID=A0A7I4KMG8_BRUMA